LDAGANAHRGSPEAGALRGGRERASAPSVIARIRGEGERGLYSGAGTCCIEFGGGSGGLMSTFSRGRNQPAPTTSRLRSCGRTRSCSGRVAECGGLGGDGQVASAPAVEKFR